MTNMTFNACCSALAAARQHFAAADKDWSLEMQQQQQQH
jgi:hypothetical protein